MSELLIFGGTTEGRLLAEYCAENGIKAAVSVATEYGASLLPSGADILCGRLDEQQMTEMMTGAGYELVIDATHPYAAEVTKNIRAACEKTGLRYIRLIRSSSGCSGRTVKEIDELISVLETTSGNILCTLGSRVLPELVRLNNYRERLWIRILPSEEMLRQCGELGYDISKVICEKGPFTVEQNIRHLTQSGASVLVTKESGQTGGYPEKAEAARRFGAELLTLVRPEDKGYPLEEVKDIIRKELDN